MCQDRCGGGSPWILGLLSLEVLGVPVGCCFPCGSLIRGIGLLSVTLLHVQQVALGHQGKFGG